MCFLIIVCFILSCRDESISPCSAFKNGDFIFHAASNNMTYSITRHGSKQVEIEQETGHKTEWEITWLSDCEYTLLLKKDSYGVMNTERVKNLSDFIYSIVTTTKDYYIFEMRRSSSTPFVRDTIYKKSKPVRL